MILKAKQPFLESFFIRTKLLNIYFCGHIDFHRLTNICLFSQYNGQSQTGSIIQVSVMHCLTDGVKSWITLRTTKSLSMKKMIKNTAQIETFNIDSTMNIYYWLRRKKLLQKINERYKYLSQKLNIETNLKKKSRFWGLNSNINNNGIHLYGK